MGQNTSLTSLIWLKGCSSFYMSSIVLTLNGTLSRNWCIVFNLSFPSNPCHWYFSTLATVPHTTASSGVKNIRLCPFAPLEFVRAQVTGHKTIFCIREKQAWANRVSSHLLCLSSAGRDLGGKLAGVCLPTVASSSSQSQRPIPSSASLSSLTRKDKGHLGFLSSWNQVRFSFYYYSM